jgi:FCP1-like phosphatase family protein
MLQAHMNSQLPIHDETTIMYSSINSGLPKDQEANTNGFCTNFTPEVFYEDVNSLPLPTKGQLDEKVKLLAQKKLSLALDLDNTLLHATTDARLIQMFQSLYGPYATSHRDLHLLTVDGAYILVKMRPHLSSFLEQASNLFELNIFTMGVKNYALAIAERLDPEHRLIKRIVSREDFPDTNTKTLQGTFPDSQDTVVIIDDRRDVWMSNLSNLIQISAYDYFRKHFGIDEFYNIFEYCSSPLEIPNDFENIQEQDETHLENITTMLQDIHTRFFEATENQDVRSIIKTHVLKDIHIYFSGLSTSCFDVRLSRQWQIAEAHGAKVYETMISEDGSVAPVTHVIVVNNKKASEIENMPGVYLVNESWLDECVSLCLRVDENNHQILKLTEHEEPSLFPDDWEYIPTSPVEEYVPEFPYCDLNLSKRKCHFDDNEYDNEQPNKKIRLTVECQ